MPRTHPHVERTSSVAQSSPSIPEPTFMAVVASAVCPAANLAPTAPWCCNADLGLAADAPPYLLVRAWYWSLLGSATLRRAKHGVVVRGITYGTAAGDGSCSFV